MIDEKKSLLRRMQAQNLQDATPSIGKIHPFSKIAVTFEPLMRIHANSCQGEGDI